MAYIMYWCQSSQNRAAAPDVGCAGFGGGGAASNPAAAFQNVQQGGELLAAVGLCGGVLSCQQQQR